MDLCRPCNICDTGELTNLATLCESLCVSGGHKVKHAIFVKFQDIWVLVAVNVVKISKSLSYGYRSEIWKNS